MCTFSQDHPPNPSRTPGQVGGGQKKAKLCNCLFPLDMSYVVCYINSLYYYYESLICIVLMFTSVQMQLVGKVPKYKQFFLHFWKGSSTSQIGEITAYYLKFGILKQKHKIIYMFFDKYMIIYKAMSLVLTSTKSDFCESVSLHWPPIISQNCFINFSFN